LSVHFKVLGLIFIAAGFMGGLLTALFTTMFMPVIAELMGAKQTQFSMILLLAYAVYLTSVVTGIGLLLRKSWARPLSICLSILFILNVPVGTALGIYGLWVMFQTKAPLAWDDYAQRG
jgi:HD-like signal output (HDOD) protein